MVVSGHAACRGGRDSLFPALSAWVVVVIGSRKRAARLRDGARTAV
jgi:hypothetical protein